MTGFLLKKTFFDLWDNLFRIVLVNAGFTVSAALVLVVPRLLSAVPWLPALVFFAGALWCLAYLAAAAACVKRVSGYGNFGFGDFFRGLLSGWPAGIFLGILALWIRFFVQYLFSLLRPLSPVLRVSLAGLAFWFLLTVFLSLQFFLALRVRLAGGIAAAVKKSFLFCIDNPLFCLFSALCTAAALLLSLCTALLFPGPAGILLFLDEGLRLRFLKYEWLEQNPVPGPPARRKVPWDVLLTEERARTGTHTLKGFFFPWKD